MSKKKRTEENTRLESIREIENSSSDQLVEKENNKWESDDIDDEEENTDQKGFDRTVD